MRTLLDKILRTGIKVSMLTGVAFTMAACYGPRPERFYGEDPDFQTDQQQLEQKLQQPMLPEESIPVEAE